MSASLYQSGCRRAGTFRSCACAGRRRSQEVLEVVLASDPAAEAEDLPRHRARVQLDEVARAVPEVARPGDELVRLEGPLAVEAQLFQGKVDHPALHVVWVDVDDGRHHAGIVGRALGAG